MSSINDQLDSKNNDYTDPTNVTKNVNVSKTTLIVSALALAIVTSAITFFLSLGFKPQTERYNEDTPKISNKDLNVGKGSTEKTQSGIDLLAVPQEYELIENSVPVTPSEGSVIINSLLSNKRDKIVYSEISKCAETYGMTNDDPCKYEDIKFNVYIKDLKSGVVKTLPLKFEISQGDLPIAWSNDDSKIILRNFGLTALGSGGRGWFYSYIDTSTFEQVKFYLENVFYSNYSKVVYNDQSDKSPCIIWPYSLKNSGKIVIKNIETGEILKTIEEPNTHYTLGKISEDGKRIDYQSETYDITKKVEGSECLESSSYSDKEQKSFTIELP